MEDPNRARRSPSQLREAGGRTAQDARLARPGPRARRRPLRRPDGESLRTRMGRSAFERGPAKRPSPRTSGRRWPPGRMRGPNALAIEATRPYPLPEYRYVFSVAHSGSPGCSATGAAKPREVARAGVTSGPGIHLSSPRDPGCRATGATYSARTNRPHKKSPASRNLAGPGLRSPPGGAFPKLA
jgi:hypothetical protein